jgi:hypothetical protein
VSKECCFIEPLAACAGRLTKSCWTYPKLCGRRERGQKTPSSAGRKSLGTGSAPRKSEVEAIGKRIEKGDLETADVRYLRQLDALLLAARAECPGLGANFQVIGEDDT